MNNLGKQFEDAMAVDNITFTANQGELVSILGPSGCGKTTLLKMIGGFIEPDNGEIFLDSEDTIEENTQADLDAIFNEAEHKNSLNKGN